MVRIAVVAATLCIAGAPGTAWSAGDRAAFENAMADLAPSLNRPNPIAFLVGIGDWDCEIKAQQGGGELDIRDAAAAFRRDHPEAMRSADETMIVDAAMSEAAKLLCPN